MDESGDRAGEAVPTVDGASRSVQSVVRMGRGSRGYSRGPTKVHAEEPRLRRSEYDGLDFLCKSITLEHASTGFAAVELRTITSTPELNVSYGLAERHCLAMSRCRATGRSGVESWASGDADALRR